MKNIILLCVIFLTGFNIVLSQEDFELTIVEKSDKPNTEKTHLYVLQLTNNTSKNTSIALSSEQINCKNEEQRLQTGFTFEFYNLERTQLLQKVLVNGNSSVKFYLKKIAPDDATKSAWNCTTIKASNGQNKILSSITMNSLVQDPTKVN